MRGLKVLIVLIGIVFFGMENTYGQETKENNVELDESQFKKTALDNLPSEVMKAVSNLAGYEVKKAFFSQEKNNKKLYKVQVARGPIVYHLIVNEKGKIIETQE